jgi:DNA mismatch endonuclease (patch repair protein)
MQAVRSENTQPEMVVRRLVHGMGFRFRLHRKDLPGKPDLVFPRLRKVVFVHGCFWHGHDCARGSRVPKKNRDYWIKKVKRNQERDRETLAALRTFGWKTTVLWECQLRNEKRLETQLSKFLVRLV